MTHKIGEKVLIKNCDLEGRPIIEGEAILVSFLGYRDSRRNHEFWRVLFTGPNAHHASRFIERKKL